MKLFLAFLLLAPIKLNILRVDGPNAIDDSGFYSMVESIHTVFAEVGVKFQSINIENFHPENSSPYLGSLSTQSFVLYHYLRQARRMGLMGKKQYTIVILPPFTQDGYTFMGGRAMQSCAKRTNRIAIANAANINSQNIDWSHHSKVAAIHELGHLFGAYHDNQLPATMMHFNALAFVKDGLLGFSELSKSQIRDCLHE